MLMGRIATLATSITAVGTYAVAHMPWGAALATGLVVGFAVYGPKLLKDWLDSIDYFDEWRDSRASRDAGEKWRDNSKPRIEVTTETENTAEVIPDPSAGTGTFSPKAVEPSHG